MTGGAQGGDPGPEPLSQVTTTTWAVGWAALVRKDDLVVGGAAGVGEDDLDPAEGEAGRDVAGPPSKTTVSGAKRLGELLVQVDEQGLAGPPGPGRRTRAGAWSRCSRRPAPAPRPCPSRRSASPGRRRPPGTGSGLRRSGRPAGAAPAFPPLRPPPARLPAASSASPVARRRVSRSRSRAPTASATAGVTCPEERPGTLGQFRRDLASRACKASATRELPRRCSAAASSRVAGPPPRLGELPLQRLDPIGQGPPLPLDPPLLLLLPAAAAALAAAARSSARSLAASSSLRGQGRPHGRRLGPGLAGRGGGHRRLDGGLAVGAEGQPDPGHRLRGLAAGQRLGVPARPEEAGQRLLLLQDPLVHSLPKALVEVVESGGPGRAPAGAAAASGSRSGYCRNGPGSSPWSAARKAARAASR